MVCKATPFERNKPSCILYYILHHRLQKSVFPNVSCPMAWHWHYIHAYIVILLNQAMQEANKSKSQIRFCVVAEFFGVWFGLVFCM